jgi:pyruvate/2-oxoglutarate dehydrogenase complex dihydrolipoamide acyltransferase (E2) component
MQTAIVIPSLDSSTAKATLVRLLVKPGDKIVVNAPVAEIETEKATFTVESPFGGTVKDLLASGGQELTVGAPLALLETSDSSAAPYKPAVTGKKSSDTPAAKQDPYSCTETARVLFNEEFPVTVPRLPKATIAAESDDAEKFAARVAISETRALSGSGLRTQQRMLWSARNIPSSSVTYPMEIGALKSRVDAFRTASRQLLNVTDVIVWAAARALRHYPEFNAFRSGAELRLYADVNVGIVYDIQGELVVPAITRADTLSVAQLAEELRALYRGLTARKLPPSKIGVATFTVSNLFGSGATQASPLVNGGQSAVLLISAPFLAPVEQKEGLRFASQVNLVLGFDHSIVNGARAAAFLKSLSRTCTDAQF